MEDDQPSDTAEKKFFGALDDYLGGVLKQMHRIFDDGGFPEVTGDELLRLKEAVYFMIKRSPEFFKDVDDVETGREIEEQVLERLIEVGRPQKEIRKAKARLEDVKELKRYGRHARVLAQTSRSEEIVAVLEDFECRWGVIDSRHSFILSSQMIYRIGNGGSNGFNNPTMEIWFPIGPKTVLILLRDPSKKVPMVNRIGREQVRSINEFGAKNCEAIASHSKRLLESLIVK